LQKAAIFCGEFEIDLSSLFADRIIRDGISGGFTERNFTEASQTSLKENLKNIVRSYKKKMTNSILVNIFRLRSFSQEL
jgi:hypothetical protein